METNQPLKKKTFFEAQAELLERWRRIRNGQRISLALLGIAGLYFLINVLIWAVK
jgi:hypothetical protein